MQSYNPKYFHKINAIFIQNRKKKTKEMLDYYIF